jgi:hypothetical protein
MTDIWNIIESWLSEIYNQSHLRATVKRMLVGWLRRLYFPVKYPLCMTRLSYQG